VETDGTENNRGTVRHGDFYSGVIKGSGFVNSGRDQSQIQATVRDSSYRFVKQTSSRRSSMCEQLCYFLTANGFISGGSGTTIRHNTQITHITQTKHSTQNYTNNKL
jgi:hypothetical protein